MTSRREAVTGDRPGIIEYIAYSYGKTLPARMNGWVARDLAGSGAAFRTVARFALPCFLILIPLWMLGPNLYVKAEMTLPIFIPLVYFAIALNKVYRRARLNHHGLDPDLVDHRAREREAQMHAEYVAKYGPRES